MNVESGGRIDDYTRAMAPRAKQRKQNNMNVASMYLKKKIQERMSQNIEEEVIGEDYLH